VYLVIIELIDELKEVVCELDLHNNYNLANEILSDDIIGSIDDLRLETPLVNLKVLQFYYISVNIELGANDFVELVQKRHNLNMIKLNIATRNYPLGSNCIYFVLLVRNEALKFLYLQKLLLLICKHDLIE
jgi:hypothetical protein